MKRKKAFLPGLLGLLSGSSTLLFTGCVAACGAGGAVLCSVPVLSLLGISSAALGRLSWLNYILIPVSLFFFAFAFYRLYRKQPQEKCAAPDAACACPPQAGKWSKITLWIALVFSVGLMGWGFMKGSEGTGQSADTTKNCRVQGAACEAKLCAEPCKEN